MTVRMTPALAIACVAATLITLSAETPRFFPMAVWYGGGKARAPML